MVDYSLLYFCRRIANVATRRCRPVIAPLLTTARERARTSTSLLRHGPQPCASANSATRAIGQSVIGRTASISDQGPLLTIDLVE